MAVLTNAGRAEVAKVLRDLFIADPKTFLIAVANGEDWWGENQAELKTFDADTFSSDLAPLEDPQLSNAAGDTLYVLNTDYTVDSQTGTVTRLATGAIPPGAQVQFTYKASTPSAALEQTVLQAEVGRLAPTALDFCLPVAEVLDSDNAVTVYIGSDLYAIVQRPTRMLLARAHLLPNDGTGDPIRAYGLFMGCAVDAQLPPGQQFYEPDQVTETGVLALATHIAAVPHSGESGLDLSLVFEI